MNIPARPTPWMMSAGHSLLRFLPMGGESLHQRRRIELDAPMPWKTLYRRERADDSEFRLPEGYVIARRIDLRQLWYAVVTAEQRSMRRAAEMLNVRQPTLSRKVLELEQEIGVKLFERSATGALPTEIGSKFLLEMRNILFEFEEMVGHARSTGLGSAGRLTVGFSTSLSAGNLRATLIEFTQRFPQLEIATVEGSRARLLAALQAGQVDIAIATGDGNGRDFKSMALWSERIIVALPETHPLSSKEILHWEDLRGERLLLSLHQAVMEVQEILIGKLAAADDRPNIVQHDVSRGDIQSLVAAGFGVSLMVEAAAGLHCPGVAYREARDGAGPTRVGYTGYWDGANGNPALENFIKLLEERYPPLS